VRVLHLSSDDARRDERQNIDVLGRSLVQQRHASNSVAGK
jgi:hypothetical protein